MRNILVVDDDTGLLRSMKIGLKTKGYQVIVASKVLNALEYLESELPKVDVVVTDYLMPGLDGLQLIDRVRRLDNHVPLIMMTAYGEKDLVVSILRSGCDGYIEKPFTIEELLQEIKRVEIKNTSAYNQLSLDDVSELVHQINNPLMAIMASAELTMLQEHNSAKIKEYMTKILKATNNIHEINRKMIKGSQSLPFRVEKVDVRKSLSDCLSMFEDTVTVKEITVEHQLGETPLYVSGSKFGLDQAFRNIILNAIEAMEAWPRRTLIVRAKSTEEQIAIHIQDSGLGVPGENLQRIFEPNYSSKELGSGLGLAIVKKIVENHGGSVGCLSGEGMGTTIKIRLPKAETKA